MTGKNTHRRASPQTQEEALKIAKSTQRPGQSKEQTKLIAQGIQKGIEQYKKLQKEKSRELDKKQKKAKKQQTESQGAEQHAIPEKIVYQHSKLAWILLILSWLIFAGYFLFN